MKQVLRIFLSIIALSLFCTGCWDSKDINEKNVVLLVCVDYHKGIYTISIEQVQQVSSHVTKQTGGSMGGVNHFTATGKSLSDARANLDSKSDHPIFLGATRVVVLTDSLSRKGILEYINRVRADPDYRKSVHLVTSSDRPETILSLKPKNDLSVGFDIEDIMNSLYVSGIGVHKTFGDMLESITVENTGFVLPIVRVENGANTFAGYSIFKTDKKIGEISKDKIRGVNFILSNKKPQAIYGLPYKNDNITTQATLVKRKVVPSYSNGRITFDIEMKILGEVMYSHKLFSQPTIDIDTFKKTLVKAVTKDVTEEIHRSQKVFECDYLDFHKSFRAKYDGEFNRTDWNKEYSKAKINLKVETDLQAAGTIMIKLKEAGKK